MCYLLLQISAVLQPYPGFNEAQELIQILDYFEYLKKKYWCTGNKVFVIPLQCWKLCCCLAVCAWCRERAATLAWRVSVFGWLVSLLWPATKTA